VKIIIEKGDTYMAEEIEDCGECDECDICEARREPEGFEPAIKCCEFCIYSQRNQAREVWRCSLHEIHTHSLYTCKDFDPRVWYAYLKDMPEREK